MYFVSSGYRQVHVIVPAAYQVIPALDIWQHDETLLPHFLIVGWDYVTKFGQTTGKSESLSPPGYDIWPTIVLNLFGEVTG